MDWQNLFVVVVYSIRGNQLIKLEERRVEADLLLLLIAYYSNYLYPYDEGYIISVHYPLGEIF